MTYNENWTTKRPREGELANMAVPRGGVTGIKVADAENFIYMLLNFATNTGAVIGSLRGQNLDGFGYVVTSYGTPIGLKQGDKTFLNSTEYSKTTERHKAIVREAWGDVTEVPAEEFPKFRN